MILMVVRQEHTRSETLEVMRHQLVVRMETMDLQHVRLNNKIKYIKGYTW